MTAVKQYDIVTREMVHVQHLSTAEMIQQVSSLLHKEFPHTDIRFQEVLEITGPEMRHLFTCIGVATDDQNKVWVMTTSGNWMEISAGHVNADFILADVIKRLNQLKNAG